MDDEEWQAEYRWDSEDSEDIVELSVNPSRSDSRSIPHAFERLLNPLTTSSSRSSQNAATQTSRTVETLNSVVARSQATRARAEEVLRLSRERQAQLQHREHLRQHHHHHHRHHHHHHHRHHEAAMSRAQSGTPVVIDLTAGDSPPRVTRPRAATSQAPSVDAPPRNPRRTNSQRISPPSLSRTDGTLVDRSSPIEANEVIDLTADNSPPYRARQPQLMQPSDRGDRARRMAEMIERRVQHHHHHHHAAAAPTPGNELVGLSFAGRRLQELQNFQNIVIGVWGNFHRPNLDPRIPVHEANRMPERPPMEVVPPAKEGFTRNTVAEPTEEQEVKVIICPACREELAYDPSEAAGQTTATGAKKRKRVASHEHHFWALKKCGHVYCAECFENRKPTKTNPLGVGFRSPDGRPLMSAPTDIRCAVDECETKVAGKSEWVGLFL